MTMIEKLTNAFDRYDILLHNHITEDVSNRNDPDLEEAARTLNMTISEAKKAEAALIEKMKVDIIMGAGNMNDHAERKDLNRNHVNYGVLITCAQVLRLMGHEVKTPCYGDGDYLKVQTITIDGKEIAYHNG